MLCQVPNRLCSLSWARGAGESLEKHTAGRFIETEGKDRAGKRKRLFRRSETVENDCITAEQREQWIFREDATFDKHRSSSLPLFYKTKGFDTPWGFGVNISTSCVLHLCPAAGDESGF
ncbi:hypothetical protein AMECASPLE_017123 [Ameca splendens]|uniref:Uncharacterized protein n=1 Tax=Ameca splendens TaxID=208324 RepID=A0ABV0Y2C5_9TELE